MVSKRAILILGVILLFAQGCALIMNPKLLKTPIPVLKMMGGAAGPEYAELLEKITISAAADNVKLEVTIPDELVEKLRKKMEKTNEAMTPPETTTEPETE